MDTSANLSFYRRAFTLMELMIVVTALGIIAGFAIPSYTKAMEQGYERVVINNLQMINAANEAYKARYGVYAQANEVPGTYDLAWINATLNLSIKDDGKYYYRFFVWNGGGECKALRSDDALATVRWGLKMIPSRVCCDHDSYPSCPAFPSILDCS